MINSQRLEPCPQPVSPNPHSCPLRHPLIPQASYYHLRHPFILTYSHTPFRHLDSVVGSLRFNPEGERDEETLAEMEGLRQYLTQATQVVDQAVAKVSSAKERSVLC